MSGKNSHSSTPLTAPVSAGITFVLLILAIGCQPAFAQDTSTTEAPTSSDGTTAGAPFVLNVPRGNPLEGLFTPQPQYPNATSLRNPEATPPPPGELNPLKGLFTPQPQYLTPQALPNPEGRPPDGETNHLKGVFTPPNQWATPQTILNEHPEPRHYVPERKYLWGADEERDMLRRQHNLYTFGSEEPPQAVKSQPPKSEKTLDKKKTVPKKGNAVEAERTKPLIEPPAKDKEPSPLRNALTLMAFSQYEKSIAVLDQLLSTKDDAQAHYLKAVALVKLHRYADATREYNEALRIQPSTRLGELARSGLAKISSAP